ncbi:MAG TPA: hypothetical protein VGI99_00750 [Gemmataceae bacterium]|jgi:predicted ATP-dependent endonuclease of OLD family
MAVATFDTLKFANTLKAAGVPDKQAEAQAVAFGEAFQVNLKDLATKDDILATRNDLKREIDDVRKDLKQEIESVRMDLKQEIESGRKDVKHEMKEMEQRLNARIDASDSRNRSEQVLLRWMVGATFTGVVAVIGLLGRLFFLIQR